LFTEWVSGGGEKKRGKKGRSGEKGERKGREENFELHKFTDL
jgi:hypothetical protein